MSIINLSQNLKGMDKEEIKQEAKTGDDEVMGVKNAIRGFVEAKKGEENAVDKGKSGILRRALKLIKRKK